MILQSKKGLKKKKIASFFFLMMFAASRETIDTQKMLIEELRKNK